jgi:hypothetical protein
LAILEKIEAELDKIAKMVGRINWSFLAKKLKALSLEKPAQ